MPGDSDLLQHPASAYSSLFVVEMILADIFFVLYMCDLNTKTQIVNWPWSDFF